VRPPSGRASTGSTAAPPRRSPRALARALARVAALVLACVTCDATTALRPAEERSVTLEWAGDTVIVVGGSLAAGVTAAIDGEPYSLARLAVTSSDTSVVSVGPDGQTLLGRKLGRAVLTVRLLSTTLATVPTLTRGIVVSPAAVRIGGSVDSLYSLGDTIRLSASAVDANEVAIPIAGVRWTSSDTSVLAVDGLGLVTARRNGAATVRAELGTQVAEAPMQVWQKAVRLSFPVPQLVLDAIGAEQTMSVVALDARGGVIARTPAPEVTWTTASATVATVAGGKVLSVGNGGTWIRASAAGATDSLRVDVVQRATRIVVETPDTLRLRAISETGVARARGYDRLDHEVTSALPAWRTLNPEIAYVESHTGIVTALSPGDGELVAEQDGASARLAVKVSNPPAQVILEPATATITSVGDTLAMRWSVRNARGVEITSAIVTLTSSDTTIVRPIAGGRIVAKAIGTVRVTATADGGVADTSFVSVIDAVENVAFLQDAVTLASVGDSAVPAAAIRNARGAEVPRSAATWTSDDPGTARVTAGGVVIAMGVGETHVRAASPTYPDRRDSIVVSVTNAPAFVIIERAADTLTAVGAARAYSAEVRNSREQLLQVAPAWRSLDGAVARVSSTGLVTALGVGEARIVATAGSVADTLLLTVRDDVASIELLPGIATLTSIGDLLDPAVLARNALGSVVAAPRVSWRVVDTTVVRLTADTSVLAVGTGTTRVIATSGPVADTMTVTVTNLPVLVDILNTRDSIRAIGDSVTLQANIRNSRGDVLPLTSVTWTADDPVVARVGATGVATARAEGTTWVRATGGTARDSTLLVVTNEVSALSIVVAASGVAATADTMTANGQQLAYSATVTNALGRVVPGVTVSWTSTAAGVASVAFNGVVSATGIGTALVIAQAGSAMDTVRVVVIDPTRLYVDNAVVMANRFGTPSRPYATIQEAVNAAGVDDTVFVRRGTGYSEAVALGRRLTLLGDSTAFLANSRNPSFLPRIDHDLGPAGITANTAGASYTIKYLAVQHSVDGDAVAIRDADNVLLDYVFVNPNGGFRTGRGILVERAQGSVLVARGRVDSVYAYGVRVADAANVRVDGMTVRGIGARSGASGAGIEVLRSQNVIVTGVAARRTAGPQVLLDATTNTSLLSSTLTGEWQLARLAGVSGATTVRGNSFDVRRQAGETGPTRTGTTADPSALEIVGSAGVLVDANTFIDVGGQTSLMDGLRLQDVRIGGTGAPYGALLTGNRFGGGRAAVRTQRATLTMTRSRIDSASTGVLATDADTLTLDTDTIASARVAAVQSSGSAAALAMTGSLVTGPQRAVVASSAGSVLLRRNTFAGVTGVVPQPAIGAIDLSAGTVEVVDNSVKDLRWAGIVVRGGIARVDSNVVTRNLVGVRIGAAAAATFGMRGNSLFDNDTLPGTARRTARGVVNEGTAVALADNWWGDPRGPRRDVPPATATYGDSATGLGTFPAASAPIGTHAGSGAASAVRKIGGDGQTGAVASTFSEPLAVRVVDAQGRPLAGQTVAWKVPRAVADFVGGIRSGSDNIISVTSDASGLAMVQLTGVAAGTATVTATVGSQSVTFTVTVQ
jgi:hypothetical protein